MHSQKSQELLLSTLAADAYCLGSHWIYDADELKNLSINWDDLNKPHVTWHQGKEKGDFTHYGDQVLILNNFLKNKTTFNIDEYMSFWREEMKSFSAYMDGATKETIKNIDNKTPLPCGSNSSDMAVIGRITPLLEVSDSKDAFLHNVKLFAQTTHNNENVVEAIDFFANLLLEILDGGDILESILKLKNSYSQNIQNYIEAGINSKNEDTLLVISKFGASCSVDFCFPSTIHLLAKYTDYKEALICNAQSGGDSSARAMVVAYILTAKNSIDIVPPQWLEYNKST